MYLVILVAATGFAVGCTIMHCNSLDGACTGIVEARKREVRFKNGQEAYDFRYKK